MGWRSASLARASSFWSRLEAGVGRREHHQRANYTRALGRSLDHSTCPQLIYTNSPLSAPAVGCSKPRKKLLHNHAALQCRSHQPNERFRQVRHGARPVPFLCDIRHLPSACTPGPRPGSLASEIRAAALDLLYPRRKDGLPALGPRLRAPPP